MRAFAPIINTLVQYGTFGISVSSTSERLDQALALVYQQAARRDALLWLLKTAPEQMPASEQEKTFVLATIVDPYEILRQHHVGKTPEKP